MEVELLSANEQDEEWMHPSDTRKWYEKIPLLPWHKKLYKPRTITRPELKVKFVTNQISNCRYTVLTFFPLCLFNQFKYFYNMYFLLTALSQLIPILKVGMTFTYFAPLVFVVGLSICKDAIDEIRIRIRDVVCYLLLYNNKLIY